MWLFEVLSGWRHTLPEKLRRPSDAEGLRRCLGCLREDILRRLLTFISLFLFIWVCLSAPIGCAFCFLFYFEYYARWVPTLKLNLWMKKKRVSQERDSSRPMDNLHNSFFFCEEKSRLLSWYISIKKNFGLKKVWVALATFSSITVRVQMEDFVGISLGLPF